MEFKVTLALSVLFVLVSAFVGEGLRIDGENFHADSDTQLVFLDRFVFQPNGKGLLEYDITIAANFCCPDIVIFSGWSSQWPTVRDKLYEMSCYDMIERATTNIPLWGSAGTCKTFLDASGVEKFRCKGHRKFWYPKDQWYYITVMNCHYKQDPGIEILDYQLHFMNGDEGLLKEFSADENTNLPVSFVFTVLLSLLFSVGFIFGVQLAHKKMLHVTYQLWIISLLLHTIGILVLAVGWFKFAHDGIRKDQTELAGHILKAAGTVVFASIMVLMSKGYTITRLTMRDVGKLKLAFFVIGFAVSHMTLYIMQLNADPKVVTNIYDTPAALGLIVIRCIGTAWSLYGVFFTMKDYPSKHAFYAVFIIFVVCWFMTEPAVAFLSTFCLPLYSRAKFVFGFDVAAITLGHLIFIWLVRPASTNQFFPFHLKTNKVDFDFLHDTDPRSNYKPSKETFDLFVTKKDDPQEGCSTAKESQQKGTAKLTSGSKPTVDIGNIFMTGDKGAKNGSGKLQSISTTIPLERMINCSVAEPPKNLPLQYLENGVTYTPVEDLRLTNTLAMCELEPSFKKEASYRPVEDLRVTVTRKNHNYKRQLSEQAQQMEMTAAMEYDHDKVLSSSDGEETRLNQDKPQRRYRKDKVQVTTCSERLQIAQDLKNLSGLKNPDLKVNSALQDTDMQAQQMEMTTATKHDHDKVLSSSDKKETRLNQDKPQRRFRKNKVQAATCSERLQIAQDLKNLSGLKNPGLKVDSALQDTDMQVQQTEMTTATKHDHDKVLSSSDKKETRLNQDKPQRRYRKNKVQATTCGERLQIAQDFKNLSGLKNPGLTVDGAPQDPELGTQVEGKFCRPTSEFRMENEQEVYWAQRRGNQRIPHVAELRTDDELEQPSVCSSDDEMDAKRRRIMELRAALEKEEIEYKMTLATTSQESVTSFESDIDAEKGDTDVTAKKKKKKRRNPIHKATKILGMKKKKKSSEQQ